MHTPAQRDQPTTVGVLEQRLRKMLGRVGKKDRQTVLDAVEAIHELAARLHMAIEADHVHLEVNPLAPHGLTPRSRAVITKIEEPEPEIALAFAPRYLCACGFCTENAHAFTTHAAQHFPELTIQHGESRGEESV